MSPMALEESEREIPTELTYHEEEEEEYDYDQEEEEDDDDDKWVTHYSSNHQILLVGEGDFSFSLSLALSFGSASNICASSLDTYDVVVRKYKKARSNLETLKNLGAFLLHGVDATRMKRHSDLKMRRFDRIIFNFPHAGFHGKEKNTRLIGMHRELVYGFFLCGRHMLRANAEIHVSHKENSPFCDWNLEKLACGSSLVLIERVNFRKDDYPGYENKRGDGPRCDKPFPLGECSTFKFRFSPRAKQIYEEMTRSRNLVTQRSRRDRTALAEVNQRPGLQDLDYPPKNHMQFQDFAVQTSHHNHHKPLLDPNYNGRHRENIIGKKNQPPKVGDLNGCSRSSKNKDESQRTKMNHPRTRSHFEPHIAETRKRTSTSDMRSPPEHSKLNTGNVQALRHWRDLERNSGELPGRTLTRKSFGRPRALSSDEPDTTETPKRASALTARSSYERNKLDTGNVRALRHL